MSTNLYKGCSCSHHRLLNHIKEGANDKAKPLLQKLKNPCDAIKKSKTTLLHYAVLHKNTKMIQPLIDHGSNVNGQDTSGDTPLILAILKSNVTTVNVLLKNNADVYASNTSGENSLQMACLKCYDFASDHLIHSAEFEILKIVFEKANSDFLNDKKTITQLVLSANNTVKLAVVANANVELAKIVLKNNYPLDFHESRCGLTALHVAMMFQNIENALLLIGDGADVDTQDYFQYSAIQCYLSDCQDIDENAEVLKGLLSRTKGLHSPNRVGDFEYFLRCGNENTVRATLENAIQSGIDVSVMKFNGDKTLLHLLIENHENPGFYRILDELDIQCDVNAYAADKRPALLTAIRSDRVEAVEFLLKHGADANFVRLDSPLLFYITLLHNNNSFMQKVRNNMPNITVILLECGADAQYVFSNGDSLIKRLAYQRGGKVLNSCDKMIVAHLALLATIKDSSLTDLTRNDIESAPFFKVYFDFCMKQLEEMKNLEVYGNVTLLKLLTKDEEKITAYTRNLEFILAFFVVMEKNSQLEQYYSITLNRRISKANDASKLQMTLALIIENLTGICSDVYYMIIYKIISYLSFKDKQNLCNIEDNLFSKK